MVSWTNCRSSEILIISNDKLTSGENKFTVTINKIQFNMGYICPQTLHQSELIAVNDCEIYKMDLLKRYKLNLVSNTWIPTWMIQPTNRCFQLWQQQTVESRLNLIDLLWFQPMEAKVLETTCYTWYWRNESWLI